MRQHAKYFYVLFVIVILSFIFWGTGTVDKASNGQPLAKIGDQVVTVQEYWNSYENVADLYRDVYGSDFDPEEMNLKQKVLNTIIEERLLLMSAQEAGITVSDEEVSDAVTHNPAFMRDGAFNREVYERTVEINRMTTSLYESLKRQELMIDKMRRLVEETVALTPEDVRGLPQDEESYKALRETLLEAKKSVALRSFVEGLKSKFPVTVNEQLIS